MIVVPRCPSSVVNGLVDDKCLRRVGDSCAVTCDPRYRLKEENKTVMCTTNTTWDDEIPCEGRKLHKPFYNQKNTKLAFHSNETSKDTLSMI